MTRAPRRRSTRRQFLRHAAFAAGGAAAAPYVLTSAALGAAGRPAASERIVMGAIGIGGRGRYVMGAHMNNEDVQMVAVCDVQGPRRDAAKQAVDRKYGHADCKTYIDLRELLARADIDAVVSATGDNWHSTAAILAIRAGKDVYSEKPCSVTIGESRALVETVRRHAAVYQCGTQRRSVGHFQFAKDLVASGRLGELKALHAEKSPKWGEVYQDSLPPMPAPPREVIDWDLWLGPAPWRPYNAQYHARSYWGGHLDFAGGSITEWGSHTADLCQWAAGYDETSPVEYEPRPGRDVHARYADGVELIFRAPIGRGSCGVRFEGTEGWVEVDDSGTIATHPASLRGLHKFGRGYPADDHVRNFLDCVKSRRQPRAHAEAAHRSITACHCANIALRLGRKVTWDPAREEFPGDRDANGLRCRTIREPWRL